MSELPQWYIGMKLAVPQLLLVKGFTLDAKPEERSARERTSVPPLDTLI